MDTLTLPAAVPTAGVSDLHHALRAEVARIGRETRGDAVAQIGLLQDRLVGQGLLTAEERKTLGRLTEVGAEVNEGKASPVAGYLESRDLLNGLLSAGAGPVAQVIASAAVGGYEVGQGADGTVVMAKKGISWGERGASAGAVIGMAWGPLGSAIGGAVGGLVGAAVDECRD